MLCFIMVVALADAATSVPHTAAIHTAVDSVVDATLVAVQEAATQLF